MTRPPGHRRGWRGHRRRLGLLRHLDPRGFTPDDAPYGKLVTGPRTELYNLRDDISETRDLAATQPAKARELRAALDALVSRGGVDEERVREIARAIVREELRALLVRPS